MQGICPGATTIVASKSVGSRTTNRQMNANSKGEFDTHDDTSQAGETDQTTRIDSTEHPESCQLASLVRQEPQICMTCLA
jgi:hypothetical protein